MMTNTDDLESNLLTSIYCLPNAVADPGFPVGGGRRPVGGRQPPAHTLLGKNVCENERN